MAKDFIGQQIFTIGVIFELQEKTPASGWRALIGSMSAGYLMQIVATDPVGPLPVSESRNRW